ncbi:hypothetical protein PsYK624_045590 [Phanerochaete sordida]|uniref:Nucleoprotein TPR/MLP1 domain-containing protein n=1 Tax=Phanerochaete sordida TaxID=48140 RepID=A0A9P3G560_9APHY|nr:hypothetical protein PsYK624_045590 [Phanerochaete sordida]
MTRTRKQSKAAAAAAAVDTGTRDPSPVPPPSQSQAELHLAIPDDIPLDVLSTLFPDAQLEAPSADTIISLYRLVVAQASDSDLLQREVEETKAELQRKDVELDQALQDRESAVRELESVSESLQNELRQAKQEKDEILASKAALESQLASISTSQTSTSTEVESLKHRIEDVEREKRDLVGVVSRLKEDAAQREEEIQTLRGNLKQARQDYQALESQVRELRSTETSTKFKLDSLSQQLQLARDEAERASADLAAKSEDFAKYRRTQHAEFAQLQAAHDSLVQTHAATESSLKTLQTSYTAQSHELTQALARVQDLKGQLAEQEATYSSEAAGLKRLVEMMEEREAQAKAIVENIENEWAGIGDRAERREVVLREEIEAQRQRAEEAESRVAELQKILDRLDRGEFPMPPGTPGGVVPSTPARGVPATPGSRASMEFLGMEGMMGLSPTVAMASRAQKGGKTFTEVYADYVKLQEEFAKKCAEYDHMDRTLAAVLAQIEERAPILAQQRQEYERLQSEASLLASQLGQAISERDANAAAAEENGQKLAKSTREVELLNQQLNDLGRQVQTLLKELGRRQDPSIPSDEEFDADTTVQPAENIEAVITNNLVLFKSIPALQEQNQKLLKVVRELGSKMEMEEREYREELEAEQQVALQEAYNAVKELQDQLEHQKKSAESTIQAYLKERDALKSMLARERAAAGRAPMNGHDEEMPDAAEAAKELAEVQAHFEAYKTEMSVDSGRVREELIAVRAEASQMIAQLAKANAKVDYLNDRQRMLQEQNAMQSKEMDNLARRNQELYDQYTRVDIECNRVSEDLLAATTAIEQLRNEGANLRAEKKIWESVQARLVDENKSLAMERAHLADLMANVQRMHHDLERSGENDRRRLESQIQMLENQTQDLRSQLSQERDAARHSALQKELELKELRTKIEKLSEDYAKTREILVAAETSKKHLEDQVEQLNRQLRGNEEKLAVYERRAPGVPASSSQDDNLSREQQLEAEVADLRSALKVAEVDLAAARSHVQQFQDISQANETALATLTSTYDEYKASTEAQLAQRESEFNALQAKFSSVQQELAQVQQKNAEVQRTFEAERAAWQQDRKTLEGTIFELSTSEKTSDNDRAAREDEVRQLEERARSAEDRYGREVLAHAESIKAVDTLRQQLSQAQTKARDSLAAAETAQAKLVASESSWKQQREALDKELADLNARIKDLTAQNNILHQHLESISSQAARIRDAANSSAAPVSGEGDAADDADTKLSELRSVVAYLRKEKEIVDLQLELSKQENTRLRTQADHLEKSLQETRKTLSEERERAVEAAASEAQHAELVERINQLTILRESNATLRAECDSHAKRAKALETKLQQLSSELDPTKEQLRMARAELDARSQQIKQLEEELRRWQERNASLLSKYDRIDPAEVQSLKEQIETLSAAKASLEEAQVQQQERITQLEAANRRHIEVGKKNNEIMKRRMANAETEKNEQLAKLQAELDAAIAERDALKTSEAPALPAAGPSPREQELDEQLQALQSEKAGLEAQIAELQTTTAAAASSVPDAELAAKLAHVEQERDALLSEKSAWSAASSNPAGAGGDDDAEKEELIKARDEALAQEKAASERAEQLQAEINGLKSSIDDLNKQLQEARAARVAEQKKAAAIIKQAVENALARQKAELQGQGQAELAARHAEEIRALEERLKKEHEEELKRAVDEAKSAIAANPDQEAAIEAAVSIRMRQLQEKHEQEVAAAVERGRMEAGAKMKLKDAQLVRVQQKLKELEALQLKSQQATQSPVTETTQPPQTAAAPPAAAAAKPAAAAAGAPKAAGPRPSGLPQKPGATAGATRGRGGAPRGGARGGAAGGLSIRGAAPAASTDAAASSADGVSIMGAASKRPREDGGEGAGEDSLAKRLKPEGAAKPVQLRRDRVPPPPPAP